jgi:hypothetical protein
MTTVKELIEELQKYDQDAFVLYAYDENGDTGVHDFINSNFIVALDEDGNLMLDEQGELHEIFNTENGILDDLQQLELLVKRGGILKPAIKLFSR